MMRYVIITPAHNEEAFIEKTLESVIKQTIPPLRWILVNDGSTDRTRQIVEHYTAQHGFIRLFNLDRPPGRHFENKARAFRHGEDLLSGLSYEYIGNLDADVSFEPQYMANILQEFEKDPKLGIGGGMIHSRLGDQYISQEVSLDSVAGAVQLFRRVCFEQVGGYMALPLGGIDSAAEIIARMKGWKVRTFPEYHVLEHRRTGSATAPPLASRVTEGRRMHSLGYSPLFFLTRCIYRSMEKPRILGSAAAICGYLANALGGGRVALSQDVVRYLRNEQWEKFKQLLRLPRWL